MSASYQICRIESYGKSSLTNIGKELEREKGDNTRHRNSDINADLTKNNVFFKRSEGGFYQAYHRILKDLHVQKPRERKNDIAFQGMVLTSNLDFFEKLGWKPGKRMNAKMREYFEDAYKFAVQAVGFRGTDANFLGCVVHLDETTPHMQLYFLPITETWQEKIYQRDASGKIMRSASGSPIQAKGEDGKALFREVTNRRQPKLAKNAFWKARGGANSFSRLQDMAYDNLGRKWGLFRGLAGSNREHMSKYEWQRGKILAQETKLEALAPREKPRKIAGRVWVTPEHYAALTEAAKKAVVLEADRDELKRREKLVDRADEKLENARLIESRHVNVLHALQAQCEDLLREREAEKKAWEKERKELQRKELSARVDAQKLREQNRELACELDRLTDQETYLGR